MILRMKGFALVRRTVMPTSCVNKMIGVKVDASRGRAEDMSEDDISEEDVQPIGRRIYMPKKKKKS